MSESIPKTEDELIEGEDYYSSMYDLFGTEDTTFNIKIVKEKLKGLIDGGYIQNFDDIALYNLFAASGLLNRHSKFGLIFDRLPKINRTKELIKDLKEWAISDDKELPKIYQLSEEQIAYSDDDSITEANPSQLQQVVSDQESALDSSILSDKEIEIEVKNLLETSLDLYSYVDDAEKIKYFENYRLNKFWKLAFDANDASKVLKILKDQGITGNEFTDTVTKKFILDFEGSKKIINEIPKNYSFHKPNLMQLYVAHKIKSQPYFLNLSGTGAGKTLSAIISSRIINSKITLIVCPNAIVDTWAENLSKSFNDSIIYKKSDVFSVTRNEKQHQYLILNWESFQRDDFLGKFRKLSKQKIDFIILDEIQFVKVRGSDPSKRRRYLEGLINEIREKNPRVKILGLSATPVVNNLKEGKSLLDLVKGAEDTGLKTTPYISNAVALHEKFVNISIRSIPKYDIIVNEHKIYLDGRIPPGKSPRDLIANPLKMEEVLTQIRIPEIVKLLQPQTVIYTEYVGTNFDRHSKRIVTQLTKAVEDAGFSVAHYTGEDHTGKELFLNKQSDVLIASKPIAVGVDGLQDVCNRLIINTLPWTNANYHQLLGRFVRPGQPKDSVDIYIIMTSLSGLRYDEQVKWERILNKRTLAECAVDGKIPKKNLVSPEKATKSAVEWYRRLEAGEISHVPLRRLTERLPEEEVKKRRKRYGSDFTEMNRKININNSIIIHEKMTKNSGEMWEEYHRRLDVLKQNWNFDPQDKIIKKIKKLPPGIPIGDFGCGRAKIAEIFGNRVHSFDHVAIDSYVTSCDMKNVPLDDYSLGIAVFCQSLMGQNWKDYIKEAARCLAKNGTLFIVEFTKHLHENRLKDLKKIIEENGFEFNKEGCYDEYKFTFIEARKI